MMRWLLTLCAALVIAFGCWWLLGAGPDEVSAGRLEAGLAGDRAPELRIEIREDAVSAQASHRIILARYGDDAVARAWVAKCIAANHPGTSTGPVSQDLLHACWQAYANAADARDLRTDRRHE